MSAVLQEIIKDARRFEPVVSRREFVKGSGTVAASAAFAALGNRVHAASLPYTADYGPLSVKSDLATGLPLLSLPEGFTYQSYGWTGQRQTDGRFTPTNHDGMAVVAVRDNVIALVRNFEQTAGEANPATPARGRGTYNPIQKGGTGNLLFDAARGKFLASWNSLGGTIRNCAGGSTPWGTWLSCEETFHDWSQAPDGQETFTGYNHGYIFEVPGFGISDGRPIRAMGRFSHEACAVDPATGFVYETEDEGESAFYKYEPNGKWGDLDGRRNHGPFGFIDFPDREPAGRLYGMVLDGIPRVDTSLGGAPEGTTWNVTWEEVLDPDARSQRCYDQASGAARISRGEGCWYDDGKIYFCATDGGMAGLGQIFVYDPRKETCTLLFESRDAVTQVDGPDNIAVSPRGSILMCEDGGSDPKRLIGLSADGETFTFAENRIHLSLADLDVINKVFPGTRKHFQDLPPADGSAASFENQEWAGATFYGRWLFVNIQTPGVTFAITGPWDNGAL